MKTSSLLPSVLIGAVASARSMTPMAALATARLAGERTPGKLVLLDHPLFKFGALAMGVGELFGDKMKTAPDRTVFLGLLARTITAGFAGAALAPPKRQIAGAALGVGAAIASSYAGLAARKWAMARWGQTSTGFVEEAIMFTAANAIANAKPAHA